MKYLPFILVLWFSSTVAIEEEDTGCEFWSSSAAKSLSLIVYTSFHGHVKFELCNAYNENTLYIEKSLVKREDESKKITKTSISEEIKLSKLEYSEIYKRFEAALKYNTLDHTASGRDGSYWCLEAQNGFWSTYTKACFYSPSSSDAEKRGIEGIYNLGVYLWSFSALDKDQRFKLY